MPEASNPIGATYIHNEDRVRGIAQIDLAQCPPPDLAVEVDITSSSLDRFAIYAALGIPEIWRFDGSTLAIYTLQAGEYGVSPNSLALPPICAADIQQFLQLQSTIGENRLVKQFRQWLRTQ